MFSWAIKREHWAKLSKIFLMSTERMTNFKVPYAM